MRILSSADPAHLARLLTVDRARDPRVRAEAVRIVRDVERRGDAALLAWRRRLDRDRSPIEVSASEIRAAGERTPRAVRRAIRDAIRRVERVAARQRPPAFGVTVTGGVRIEQRAVALDRVACYVPGGRYPLPSTAIMTVVPARVAGVNEILVCCTTPSPEVLCAASEAGATRIFRMGGAQAVAAFAYGTRTVPHVDKIVGPGNAWVTAAKDLVAYEGRCTIDMHAGPSEIVILSDAGSPAWIAADLVAQAEHDPDARAVLVTTRPSLATMVAGEVTARLATHPAARPAIARHGAIVVARSRREAYAIVTQLAPEHLVCDREQDIARCGAAGTIFVGRWSAQAAGDYATGSNHVLPTGSAARWRGGLGTADFMRVFTIQRLTRRGLQTIAPSAIALATAEGLDAHAASILLRVRSDDARRE
jgi:histidinol dehydrogenase